MSARPLTVAAWLLTCSLAVSSALAGTMIQQGVKLVGTGNSGGADQGMSVAVSGDGNTAVSGGWLDNASVGAVWVYTRTAGAWSQQGAKLVGTGTVGVAYFGSSAALSSDGNTLVIGGNYDNLGVGAA